MIGRSRAGVMWQNGGAWVHRKYWEQSNSYRLLGHHARQSCYLCSFLNEILTHSFTEKNLLSAYSVAISLTELGLL